MYKGLSYYQSNLIQESPFLGECPNFVCFAYSEVNIVYIISVRLVLSLIK
jgi:hypothetical protein